MEEPGAVGDVPGTSLSIDRWLGQSRKSSTLQESLSPPLPPDSWLAPCLFTCHSHSKGKVLPPPHTFCRSGCLGLGEALPQWGGRGGPGPLLPGRRESKSHGVGVGAHGGSPGTYWDIAPCSTASSNTGGGGSVYTGGKGEVKTTAEAVSTPRWVHVDVKSDGSCPLYGPHAC